ncbi:hypothetical protein ABT298_09325 [Streptomyces sp. NPDC001034]|uniref:hypothetical protein n=1 Tax=Streptomyces sp. NPDC001034 TaxID=3154375 RepID=UPI00332D06D6
MTVTDTATEGSPTPPPPPATIGYEGEYGKNPLEEAGFRTMCGRLPAVLGRTARMAIVVTHQLENTRLADRIIVMRHGRIVEQGHYDELVHGGGLFAELVALAEDC